MSSRASLASLRWYSASMLCISAICSWISKRSAIMFLLQTLSTTPLERDDFSSNRHPALSYCLSIISAQTLRVCREGKPVPTFPDHALGERGGRAHHPGRTRPRQPREHGASRMRPFSVRLADG